MQEHKFTYRGKDLIAPLEVLLLKLSDFEKKTRDELINFDRSTLPKNIIAIDPATQHYLHLDARHKTALADLKKAENWLRECKRTKWTKWVLDFHDLEWLYREKI